MGGIMKKPEGEWKFKNGFWHRAIFKKEWRKYIQRTCPICNEDFLSRHEVHTCSKSCGKKLTWKKFHKTAQERTHKTGFVYIYKPDNPMADRRGWIAKHRYVMSEILNRPLARYEFIHHINRNRSDNTPENLLLLTRGSHNIIHKKDEVKHFKRDKNGKFTF